MAYGIKNKVKLDPLQYNIGLLGESGIGKTTIINQLCNKLLGDEGYLFLECGKEDGADAIEGIPYINCPKWEADFNEYSNSVGFVNVIDDILENKTTEYPNLKVVVVDTYDQLVDIAKDEVIRMWNRKHPDKKAETTNGAFGGFMKGDDKASDIILDKLWDLKDVGVHFIIIGHIKAKEGTDAVSGMKYSKLGTDMSDRDFNKIKNKLHFLGVAYIDRDFIREKSNKKDKNGNPVYVNKIKSEARKIKFRDDNYAVDSKSRFAEIEPEINFDVEELYRVLIEAIKNEQSKSSISFDKQKEEQEKKELERAKEIAENEKVEKGKSLIIKFINDNKEDNVEKVVPILEKTRELGYENPTKVNKLKDIKVLAKLCK